LDIAYTVTELNKRWQFVKENKMLEIKPGSIWGAVNGIEFRVISVTNVDGHEWVHYISVDTGIEFSCWTESFVNRFREESNRGT